MQYQEKSKLQIVATINMRSVLETKVSICTAIDAMGQQQQEQTLQMFKTEMNCNTSSNLLHKILFSTGGCLSDVELQNVQQNDTIQQSLASNNSQPHSLLASMPNDVMACIFKFLSDKAAVNYGYCCRQAFIVTQQPQLLKSIRDRTFELNDFCLPKVMENAEKINLNRWQFSKHLIINLSLESWCDDNYYDANWASKECINYYRNKNCYLLRQLMSVPLIQSMLKSIETLSFINDGISSLPEWPMARLFDSKESALNRINIEIPFDYEDWIEETFTNFNAANEDWQNSECKENEKINIIQYGNSVSTCDIFEPSQYLINFGQHFKHLVVGNCRGPLINASNQHKFTTSIGTISMLNTVSLCDINIQDSLNLNIQSLNLLNSNFQRIHNNVNDEKMVQVVNIDKSLTHLFVHWIPRMP